MIIKQSISTQSNYILLCSLKRFQKRACSHSNEQLKAVTSAIEREVSNNSIVVIEASTDYLGLQTERLSAHFIRMLFTVE